MKISKISMAITGGAIALGMGASMGMASAGPVPQPPVTVTATTSQVNSPDTTTCTTSILAPNAQYPNSYGPVWALDTVQKSFRITSLGSGNYAVSESVSGFFRAFSQPNNTALCNVNNPLVPQVSGTLYGVNTFTVSSPNAPSARFLPRQEPAGYGTSAMLTAIFGGNATVGGGDTWVFTYVGPGRGNTMTQRYNTAPSTWGNITEPVHR